MSETEDATHLVLFELMEEYEVVGICHVTKSSVCTLASGLMQQVLSC